MSSIDWLIFIDLPDRDLVNLCRVSKEMAKLCNDEKFWEARIKKFRENWPYKDSPKKPGYMTWKAYYVYLINHPLRWNIFDKEKFKSNPKKLIIAYDAFPKSIREPQIGDIIDLHGNDNLAWKYLILSIDKQDIIAREIDIYVENNEIKFPIDSLKYLKRMGVHFYKDFLNNVADVDNLKNPIINAGYGHSYSLNEINNKK